MNQYLIPANSKKGQLIFNIFRPIDLGVLAFGAILTLAFMFALPGDDLWVLVVKLLPIGISALLVMPIPFYHNGLVFLTEAYLFFSKQKIYHWKGWCASDVSEPKK